VKVPNNISTYILVFNYAVVFQDPQHDSTDQPRFEVSAYDSASGALVPCSHARYLASSALPGFTLSNKGIGVYYKPWSSASIFLDATTAGKTIALDFATGDCDQGQHFGYAYIDLSCDTLQTFFDMSCSPNQTVTMTGPPGFKKYEWMDSAKTTVLDTGMIWTTKVPNKTTYYALSLTPYDGFGCYQTLYMKVANMSVDVPDTTLCISGTSGVAQLHAEVIGEHPPFTYNWSPATGLSCTNCANPFATLSATTKYYVTATDTTGCTKNDSTEIIVSQRVYSKLAQVDDTVCQYGELILKDTAFNNQTVGYFWGLDTGGVVTEGDGKSAIRGIWVVSGLKKVKVKVSNGACHDWDSTEVFVKRTPLASFEIKYNLCLGEITNLYPREEPNSKYYWTIFENPITDNTYKEYFPLRWDSLGKKPIYLKVVADNGCWSDYDTVVRVHPYPTGKIVQENSDYCLGETLNLSTDAGDYYTYAWSPQQYFIGANVPTISARLTQPDTVKLTVTSQWGCSIHDSLYINSSNCCKTFAPGGFTPNGDGKNDVYHVKIPSEEYLIYTFMIVDRWGKTLFKSNNINEGWDGTYNNDPQDIGTYHYYLKYTCHGKNHESKGNFILIK
jgi:gliding motility-associated-like protein